MLEDYLSQLEYLMDCRSLHKIQDTLIFQSACPILDIEPIKNVVFSEISTDGNFYQTECCLYGVIDCGVWCVD